MAIITPPALSQVRSSTTSFRTALGLVASFPLMHRACAIGDSITANGGTAAVNPYAQPGYGYTTWATALLGEQLSLDPGSNYAVGGTTTTQIRASQLPQALADSAGICFVGGGTNDSQYSVSPSQGIANMTAIYDALIADGKLVIALTVPPRTGQTASYLRGVEQLNNAIRRYARINSGIIVIDTASVLGDPATGIFLANLTVDGTHPNATGAKAVGKLIADRLRPFLPVDDFPLLTSPVDTWNATDNPTGTLVTNGTFSTTGGGAAVSSTPGSLVTGTMPSGWTATFNGKSGGTYTGTAAISTVARTDGKPGNWLRFLATTLSGGNATDALYFNSQTQFTNGATPIGNVLVGDALETAVEFSVNATAGLTGLGVVLYTPDGAASGTTVQKMGLTTGNGLWPQGAYDFVLKMPPFIVPAAQGANTRWFTLQVIAQFDTLTAPATVDLRIGRCSVRKVV